MSYHAFHTLTSRTSVVQLEWDSRPPLRPSAHQTLPATAQASAAAFPSKEKIRTAETGMVTEGGEQPPSSFLPLSSALPP